jgi:outer membrane protein
MKRYKSATILSIIFLIGMQGLMAQNAKFGHINSDELIQAMPEYDSAKVHLEKFRLELLNYLESLSDELNTKYETLNKESKNLRPAIKQIKEQELYDLNSRIQEFQMTAQNQLEETQTELFQPIYAKVERAINEVGKEYGYLYIFNTSQGELLYFDESKSTNVSAFVKAKL